ncbi:hypothetical protein [Phenylobacterium sp.]|uniref:hypothetical protein n=1 Tax=Phenylobacterium sp. TaxID=1871053 RepID=UPI0037C8EB09
MGSSPMWESNQVAVGPWTDRGRYRLEGRRMVLEWRCGRITEWCGILKPEIVAKSRLRQPVTRQAA